MGVLLSVPWSELGGGGVVVAGFRACKRRYLFAKLFCCDLRLVFFFCVLFEPCVCACVCVCVLFNGMLRWEKKHATCLQLVLLVSAMETPL